MNYGLPYRGSKNKIAKKIVDLLPQAEYFVDLFCGGCAVTHAAMLSGKYEKFIINDIQKDIPELFAKAVAGKVGNELPLIGRDEFQELKDKDPLIGLLYSFGNNRRSYLWSEKNEKIKLLATRMIMAENWQERRRQYIKFISALQKLDSLESIENLPHLERLERIQNIERLERLKQLSSIQNIPQVFSVDYQNVKIPANAVVYCDPPYFGKEKYKINFDYSRFHEWLRGTDFPVYVSEYSMPEDFAELWSIKKTCTMAPNNNTKKTMEKIFVHKKWVEEFRNASGWLM